MTYIVAAIMWLAPTLGHVTAAQYAKFVVFEAKWYRIDVFDVLAYTTIESRWKKKLKSPTNDYGLMQVHVAKRGSSRFYGRATELYDPQTNIREGIRIMDMWKRYHERVCPKGSHSYLAHMKWGKKVKSLDHSEKVLTLRATLVRRFAPKPLTQVAQNE